MYFFLRREVYLSLARPESRAELWYPVPLVKHLEAPSAAIPHAFHQRD